jgi:hypothetical protein
MKSDIVMGKCQYCEFPMGHHHSCPRVSTSGVLPQKSKAAPFSLSASFDASVWQGKIECTVSSDMDYDGTLAAMIRLRDHLTARIEAAPHECPAAKRAMR